MAKYAKTSNQAARTVAKLQILSREQKANSEVQCIKSLGTARDYESCIKRVNDWAKEKYNTNIEHMTVDQAKEYLTERSRQVTQKTLDQERHAIQKVMQYITGELKQIGDSKVVMKHMKGHTVQLTEKVFETIDRNEFLSKKEKELESRALTKEQFEKVLEKLPPEHKLSAELAYYCGFRAHELLIIQRANEIELTIRPEKHQSEYKFAGLKDFTLYRAPGKGGRVNEFAVPNNLAQRLEAVRLAKPETIRDRGINRVKYYDLKGGQAFSQAFSRACKAALGFSVGAHGLRHSDAQNRMITLQNELGISRYDAKEAVSQELGHWRASITETYLR